MTTGAASAPPAARIRLSLLGVLFGMLLSMLDNFIVGTAMPTIVGDLGGVGLLSWVVTAYTLATAVSTPIWGKLGDLYGRKLLFQIAVTGFVAGSVLAALAPSMGLLVGARAFQGLAAGGLAVGAFAVIGDLVPPRERGRYQGMVAVVVATGTIGGPLVGGFVTDGLGWRWAFLINLPLGALTLLWVGILLKLPHVRRHHVRIDWLGALLLGGAISATVLLTTWAGSAFAWGSIPSAGLALTALACLAAFIRQERHSPEPLLPLSVFANRSFSMAAALAFVTGVVSFACVLYIPLFQQTVQGASARDSGLLLLPMMIPLVVVSQVAGRIMTATGRYKVFPVVGAVSLVAGGSLLATMTTSTTASTTAVFMVFMGIGSGLTQMTTTIAQNSVEQSDIGTASGAVTLLRSIGGSIGVAVFGTVYASQTAGLTGVVLQAGAAHATSVIFLVVACVSALGVAAALALHETPLRGSTSPTATPTLSENDPVPSPGRLSRMAPAAPAPIRTTSGSSSRTGRR